jgi:hypothetical protein
LYIEEALNLLQTIKLLQGTPVARQIKFGYMLAYNRRLLEAVEESYQTALNAPDDDADTAMMAKFEKDRVAALEAVAVKDSNGQPLIENNTYVIDNLAKKLPPIEAKLSAAYPKVAKIIQERNKRISALNREEQDVALRKMPIADWPDLPDTLPPDAMNSVMFLVQED